MSLQIKEVRSGNDLKKFIHLPVRIHKGHVGWIPPLFSNERNYFNPARNRALTYSDYKLLLAYQDGKPVGRIMGIINNRCNEYQHEKVARFGYFECPDDQGTAHALLSYIEDWAREKGMTKLVGPMGFYNQDPAGLLLEGFEHNPTINTNYNFQFIPGLLENESYVKEVDYVVYKIDLLRELPDIYSGIYKRITGRGEYILKEFASRRQIKAYILPILELMNECFAGLYGYTPLDDEEMRLLAKRFMPVLDPRFVKAVTKEDEIIGFNIAMPNLSEGFRKAGGRLFPLGIIYILMSARKSRQLDTLIGGIREEYRGRGLDVMMAYSTVLAARNAGFVFADSHHELEDNKKVRAEMERLGGEIYKRYRIYRKELVF
jgi:GNAT superfamily N-acetyltransferase